MSARWDSRTHVAGRWPRGVWTRSILVVLLAMSTGIGLSVYAASAITPVQRFYLAAYARSTAFSISEIIPPSWYRLLLTANREHVATEAEIQDRHDLVWVREKLTNRTVRDQLQRRIYGATLTDFVLGLIWPAWLAAGVVLVLGLLVTVPKDLRRRRAVRTGVRLRGRELVEADEFNARTPADGLRVWLGRGVIRK